MSETENIKKIIKRAAEILTTNEWIKGKWAATAEGKTTWIFDQKACKFCALGALHKAAWDLNLWDLRTEAQLVIGKHLGELNQDSQFVALSDYNDLKAEKLADILDIFAGTLTSLG